MKGNHKNIFAPVGTAWCGKCKNFLLREKFSKNVKRFNGLQNYCKEHQKSWYKTPEGKAERIWQNIVYRTSPNNQTGKNQCYAGIKLKATKTEFIAWAITELKEWSKVNDIELATIDRADATKDYQLDNLQILSKKDNFRKLRRNKRVHAPNGQSWCRLCKDYLSLNEFHSDVSRFNKVASLCKNHAKQEQKRKYDVRKII